MNIEKILGREVKLEIESELNDLARRYVKIYNDTVRPFNEEGYVRYQVLVHDEPSGITRGLLERLGYVLRKQKDFGLPGRYWITLRTRTEKRGKKK